MKIPMVNSECMTTAAVRVPAHFHSFWLQNTVRKSSNPPMESNDGHSKLKIDHSKSSKHQFSSIFTFFLSDSTHFFRISFGVSPVGDTSGGLQDPLVLDIVQRMHRIARVPMGHAEPLQADSAGDGTSWVV